MERAADRAQAAAVSHYLSSLTDFFCSSLPTDSGKTDRFVMRPRSLVGGRNTSDLVTVTVTVTVTKETEAKYTGRMLACFQQPGGLNKKPDCLLGVASLSMPIQQRFRIISFLTASLDQCL